MDREKLKLAASIALILAVYGGLVALPAHRRMATARADAAALGLEIDARAMRLASLVGLAAQTSNRQVDPLDQPPGGPSQGDPLPAFVQFVSERIETLGLQQAQLEPSAVVQDGALSATPVKLMATGSFKALHQFVRDLECGPLLLRVVSVQMRRSEADPAEHSDADARAGNRLFAELNVRLYGRSDRTSGTP